MACNPATLEKTFDPEGFTFLPVGRLLHTELHGEAVVVIGTDPSGLPAILTHKGWATLQRWKLRKLIVSRGRVCATGEGYGGRPHVARFLTGAPITTVVEHRNGNLLDLRESNLAVVPRSLKRCAEMQRRNPPPPPEQSSFVVLKDGRIRSRRRPVTPNAEQRYAALVGEQPATTAKACGSD